MTARLPSFAIPLLLLTLIPHASATTSSENDAEIRALRAQLQQMKGDSQALEARLRELEAGSDGDPHAAAAPLREPASQASAAATPTTRTPMATPATPATALTPGYTPSGPALRQAADPAPYDSAAEGRLAMFRVAFSPYRWVPVGNRQLALFNTYDQAYLLGFATDCPGLLYTTRLQIQDFSTHVRAGEHAVIADGQHCLIATIDELNINKLPKALRP